jgi:hypothetical protein
MFWGRRRFGGLRAAGIEGLGDESLLRWDHLPKLDPAVVRGGWFLSDQRCGERECGEHDFNLRPLLRLEVRLASAVVVDFRFAFTGRG